MPDDPTLPEAHPLVPWLTPQRRAYLYRVAMALVLLGVALDVLAPGLVGRVLELVAAVLSTSVAAAHTPTAPSPAAVARPRRDRPLRIRR